jgi:hypothetical protein
MQQETVPKTTYTSSIGENGVGKGKGKWTGQVSPSILE